MNGHIDIMFIFTVFVLFQLSQSCSHTSHCWVLFYSHLYTFVVDIALAFSFIFLISFFICTAFACSIFFTTPFGFKMCFNAIFSQKIVKTPIHKKAQYLWLIFMIYFHTGYADKWSSYMQMVGKTLAYALTLHKFAFCLKNLLEEFIIPKYVNPSYQPLQNCPTVALRTLQNDQL